MEEKKSLGKELQEKLTFTQPHIADEQPDAVAEAERFCVDYKAFLDAAKTEREAAAEVERRALAAGYRPMQRTGVTYKAGARFLQQPRQSHASGYAGQAPAGRGRAFDGSAH